MVGIETRKDLERWLRRKPGEAASTVAARAALRVLPLIAVETGHWEQRIWPETIFLPCARSALISKFSDKLPSVRIEPYAVAPGYSDADIDPGVAAARALAAVVRSLFDTDQNARSFSAASAAAYASIANSTGTAESLDDLALPTAVTETLWHSVETDCRVIDQSAGLWRTPLWPQGIPFRNLNVIRRMIEVLLAEGTHWQVFFDWYQDRLDGDEAAAQRGRPSIPEMELEIAAIKDKDWKKGSEHVFGLIREIQERYWGQPKGTTATLEEIVSVASPTSALSDGKIDIAPNPEVDRPVDFEGLRELPATQIAISGVLLDSMPGNTPLGMKNALGQYRAELVARGAYPVIGILRAMYGMICAERSASEADIWLAPGMIVGFDAFDQNHKLLITHFPLQKKADEILSRLKVDEEKAAGLAFVEPFRLAVEFAKWAQENGVATDDVLKYVKAMREVAEDVARLPVPAGDLSNVSAADSVLGRPTEQQRVLGSAIGYFERTYNLLGTTATLGGALANPAQFVPLMEKVRQILDWLLSLANF